MYDFPWITKANDALWAAVAARLREGGLEPPAALARGADLEAQWRDPGLIFGQTCGYPFLTRLQGIVTLIATPEYAFPGCEGLWRRSFLVSRSHDPKRDLGAFRGARAAINNWDSDTGISLFRATIAPIAGGRSFFSTVLVTGSHEASLTAVADYQA